MVKPFKRLPPKGHPARGAAIFRLYPKAIVEEAIRKGVKEKDPPEAIRRIAKELYDEQQKSITMLRPKIDAAMFELLIHYPKNPNDMRAFVASATYAVTVHEVLRLHDIEFPLKDIFEIVEKKIGPDDISLFETGVGHHEAFLKFENEVLKRITQVNKEKFASTHGRMKNIRIRSNRFGLREDRAIKKVIFAEARRTLIASKGTQSVPIMDAAVRRAFKMGRLSVSKRLQGLGFNPDMSFDQLGVSDTPEGRNHLKVLTHVFRTVHDPEQQKAIVQRMLKKYAVATSYQPLPAVARPEIKLNPNKRRGNGNGNGDGPSHEEVQVKAPAPKKELPSTLGGFLSHFKNLNHVGTEDLRGLRSVLQHTKPSKQNEAQIISGIEHVILSVIATRFQKSGRVSETVLRHITVGHHLVPQFERALSNLRKKGSLAYESHAGRSDFITLNEKDKSGVSKILGKYNARTRHSEK